MTLRIEKLTQESAEEISGWKYPDHYQWTLLGEGSENELYLLSEKHRKDRYHQIFDDSSLIGYYSLNDAIRKEYGALQLLIRPDHCEYEMEKAILDAVLNDILANKPEVRFVNAICHDDQKEAMRICEECGFENKGPVVSMGHDMSSYEQDGFDRKEDGTVKKETELYILSKKIR